MLSLQAYGDIRHELSIGNISLLFLDASCSIWFEGSAHEQHDDSIALHQCEAREEVFHQISSTIVELYDLVL